MVSKSICIFVLQPLRTQAMAVVLSEYTISFQIEYLKAKYIAKYSPTLLDPILNSR